MRKDNLNNSALDKFMTEHVDDVRAKMELIIGHVIICKTDFKESPNCASINDIAIIKEKLNEVIASIRI